MAMALWKLFLSEAGLCILLLTVFSIKLLYPSLAITTGIYTLYTPLPRHFHQTLCGLLFLKQMGLRWN